MQAQGVTEFLTSCLGWIVCRWQYLTRIIFLCLFCNYDGTFHIPMHPVATQVSLITVNRAELTLCLPSIFTHTRDTYSKQKPHPALESCGQTEKHDLHWYALLPAPFLVL